MCVPLCSVCPSFEKVESIAHRMQKYFGNTSHKIWHRPKRAASRMGARAARGARRRAVSCAAPRGPAPPARAGVPRLPGRVHTRAERERRTNAHHAVRASCLNICHLSRTQSVARRAANETRVFETFEKRLGSRMRLVDAGRKRPCANRSSRGGGVVTWSEREKARRVSSSKAGHSAGGYARGS